VAKDLTCHSGGKVTGNDSYLQANNLITEGKTDWKGQKKTVDGTSVYQHGLNLKGTLQVKSDGVFNGSHISIVAEGGVVEGTANLDESHIELKKA
jgi:hypothetical protein